MVNVAELMAEAFIRIPAIGPFSCQILELALSAADDRAIHEGAETSCRSSTVASGVTLKVPLELPEMAKLIFAPLTQSRLMGREVPTLLKVTAIGLAMAGTSLVSCGV